MFEIYSLARYLNLNFLSYNPCFLLFFSQPILRCSTSISYFPVIFFHIYFYCCFIFFSGFTWKFCLYTREHFFFTFADIFFFYYWIVSFPINISYLLFFFINTLLIKLFLFFVLYFRFLHIEDSSLILTCYFTFFAFLQNLRYFPHFLFLYWQPFSYIFFTAIIYLHFCFLFKTYFSLRISFHMLFFLFMTVNIMPNCISEIFYAGDSKSQCLHLHLILWSLSTGQQQ